MIGPGIIRATTSIFILLVLTCCIELGAQTLDDAVRYSSVNRLGTARGFGTAGAMSSIGADFGSLAANPAGVAAYRGSELQITPGLAIGSASSTLTNAISPEVDENKTQFMLPSASYVNVNNIRSRRHYVANEDGELESRVSYSPWTRTVFAIGLNRVNQYNHKFRFEGEQNNSMTQYFIEQSNGLNPDNLDAFVAGPAYDAYITAWDPNTNLYRADIDRTTVVNKGQTVNQRGGLNEISLTFGADLKEKFQVGASMIFPVLRYKEKKSYSETLEGDPVFNSILFEENLTARGGGISFKVGAKYILAKKVHISAAFHAPYWFRITEDYDTRAVYDYKYDPDLFDQPGPQEGLSPVGNFEYDFRSPWRVLGGVGFLIGRGGFISTEVEYVDYTTSKFNIIDDPAYQDDLNRQIDDNLGQAITVRIGGELRVKQYRFRAGYSLTESPYADESGLDQSSLSCGVGVWINRFFIDMGYRHELIEQRYSPYTLNSGPSPIVESDLRDNILLLTLGVKL